MNGESVEEVVAALENELALERAKNAVLLEKLLATEDEMADTRLSEFADVIPNEDREYWRGQFLENSKAASEFLGRLRNRIEAPAGGAAPVKQTPRPMHNRAAAPMPKSSPGAGVVPSAEQDLAAKIRNRAQEIANRDRISFTAAFSRAERELRG
ncbi:MAG: hypothetical protein BWY06_02370 [Candidatus Latescibacteria bacterium ADurb.Bin168]|nr:MAG: hypothetical protein BWY06_02370 [Candidatus Latescibacteria bacterium ADurb.Bin168]